jgi:hypothetical protein
MFLWCTGIFSGDYILFVLILLLWFGKKPPHLFLGLAHEALVYALSLMSVHLRATEQQNGNHLVKYAGGSRLVRFVNMPRIGFNRRHSLYQVGPVV